MSKAILLDPLQAKERMAVFDEVRLLRQELLGDLREENTVMKIRMAKLESREGFLHNDINFLILYNILFSLFMILYVTSIK